MRGLRRRDNGHDTGEQPRGRALLFPAGQDVTLQDGETVTVTPWSIETTETILARIPAMFEMVQKGDAAADISSLAGTFFKELQTLVEISLGWERGDVKQRCTTLDLLSLVEAIWDLNVSPIRAKLQGLGDRVAALIGQPLKTMLPSSQPSTS